MTVCQANMPIGIAAKLADGPLSHEWKMLGHNGCSAVRIFLQAKLAVAEYGGKGDQPR
jgi:hypothetical protein